MSRTCLWVLAAALSASIGFHWALLQTVAWTGMIIKYSRDSAFTVAVSKTFDGQHACCLCRLIQKGRTQEKKHDQQQSKPSSKSDLELLRHAAAVDFACEGERISFGDSVSKSRSDEPPKPRPRNAAFLNLA